MLSTGQTVIAIEKGRHSPSLEMGFRIAQALNVTLDDVFQYPVPSTNQGDKQMSWSQRTGRFVDEIRKLTGRRDTERLVDKIDNSRIGQIRNDWSRKSASSRISDDLTG